MRYGFLLHGPQTVEYSALDGVISFWLRLKRMGTLLLKLAPQYCFIYYYDFNWLLILMVDLVIFQYI